MQTFQDLLGQHQMYAHRASTAVVAEVMGDFDWFAKKLRTKMVVALDEMSQRDVRAFVNGRFNTPRSKALRDEIEKSTAIFIDKFGATMNSTGVDYANYEANWMMDTVTSLAKGYEKTILKGSKIYEEAIRQPIVGYLFDDRLMTVADHTKRRIFASIRSDISNGATNSEIVKRIFGTKRLRHRDGDLNSVRISIDRNVRTIRNHLSIQAYDETYEMLGITHVRFESVIDGRTSMDCANFSGEIYKRTDPHPTPPLHPNCRSQLVPYDEKFIQGRQPTVRVNKNKDGKFVGLGKLNKKEREELGYQVEHVKAGTTYASWFKRQDASFQRDYLGKTRYELYSKGEMTFDRFSDDSGKKLNLFELRKKDVESFKRIGL